jgi:hypothetical protein
MALTMNQLCDPKTHTEKSPNNPCDIMKLHNIWTVLQEQENDVHLSCPNILEVNFV